VCINREVESRIRWRSINTDSHMATQRLVGMDLGTAIALRCICGPLLPSAIPGNRESYPKFWS
jgi:hypothetical protein